MRVILITGANRGLGLEFTRQYAAAGCTVIATCRNPIQPGELATLQGNIQVHGLDVTDARSIERLAKDLEGRAIDILINNAGVYGPKAAQWPDLDYAAWEEVLRVNALAPMRLAAAFHANLKAGIDRKLVTVTSKMGSMTDNTSGGSVIYRSSKAAVNAVMKTLAHDWAADGIGVLLLHPGWVKTDMGGPHALIDTATSVEGMRRVIEDFSLPQSGHFYDFTGAPVPW
ncbi:MAG: SDR family oxidoreductase [Rhodospirillales bacterium]